MFTFFFLVDEAEENGKKAIAMLDKAVKSSEDFNNKFTAWNHSMIDKLESLRDKITAAHQIADGVNFYIFIQIRFLVQMQTILSCFQIRISISGQENGTNNVCIRTYQPKFLEPSTRTTIVLSYAISSNERDALLFYLSSKTTVC